MYAFVGVAPLMSRSAFAGSAVSKAPAPAAATVTMKASKAIPFLEAPQGLDESKAGCTFVCFSRMRLMRFGERVCCVAGSRRPIARAHGASLQDTEWSVWALLLAWERGSPASSQAAERPFWPSTSDVQRLIAPETDSFWYFMCFVLSASAGALCTDVGFDPLYLSNYLNQDYAAQGELKSTFV